jgi:hypothetical protein
MKSRVLALLFCCVLFASAQRGDAQTYALQAGLSSDPAFIERVKVAAVKLSIDDIQVESVNTPNHDARLLLAHKVVQSPDSWARLIAVGVAADMTFTSATSDAAIFSRVGFIWNVYTTTP